MRAYRLGKGIQGLALNSESLKSGGDFCSIARTPFTYAYIGKPTL
jgi:hypothetical protein